MATNVIETREISVTPTVDTSIYASGDVIGGVMTFANALRSYTRAGKLVAATLFDKTAASTLAACTLWVFNADPTSSTTTDQGAFNLADADVTKVAGIVAFTSDHVFDGGTGNQVIYQAGLYVPVTGQAPTNTNTDDTDLYAVLVSGGTPTFAAATDLIVRLTIEQD